MRKIEEDGRLQVIAGMAALDRSRLVTFNFTLARFEAPTEHAFEEWAEVNVDLDFGRLLSWIVFSAGAEFLAKGVCLANNIEIRDPCWDVPVYPAAGDIRSWSRQVRGNANAAGTDQVTNFGTIGSLTRGVSRGVSPPLVELCKKRNPSRDQSDLVIAGYRFLADAIRNRDAHAYNPNVRAKHFYLVEELFVECFNLLLSWLPGGSVQACQWRRDTRSFIAALR